MNPITLLHLAVIVVLAYESIDLMARALRIRASLRDLDGRIGTYLRRLPLPPQGFDETSRVQLQGIARQVPMTAVDVDAEVQGMHSGAMHLLMLATFDIAASMAMGATEPGQALGVTGAVVFLGWAYGKVSVALSLRLRRIRTDIEGHLIRLRLAGGIA